MQIRTPNYSEGNVSRNPLLVAVTESECSWTIIQTFRVTVTWGIIFVG